MKHLIASIVCLLALGAGNAGAKPRLLAHYGPAEHAQALAPIWPVHHRRSHISSITLTLAFRLQANQSQQGCTRGIAASAQITPTVALNGRVLTSVATSDSGWIVDYTADGTLIELHSYPGNGPVCAKAMTWQPNASVILRFAVVG